MTDQISPIAEAFLWSDFGAAELIVGLIVGCLMLAFALPAKLHGEIGESDRDRATGLVGPRRR